MMTAQHRAADTSLLELEVARLIDAPRPLVFQAWTRPEHAARWWGPQGFIVESCRLDATVGGSYRVAMRGPDGTVRTKRGVYREVVVPERLVFTYAWEGANGDPGHEMRVTVTFEAQGERTLLTLRQTGFENVPERDSHRGGWTSCLERFAEDMTLTATR
jgi:uncharacterized protein YndB with AHSA1/START domain